MRLLADDGSWTNWEYWHKHSISSSSNRQLMRRNFSRCSTRLKFVIWVSQRSLPATKQTSRNIAIASFHVTSTHRISHETAHETNHLKWASEDFLSQVTARARRLPLILLDFPSRHHFSPKQFVSCGKLQGAPAAQGNENRFCNLRNLFTRIICYHFATVDLERAERPVRTINRSVHSWFLTRFVWFLKAT